MITRKRRSKAVELASICRKVHSSVKTMNLPSMRKNAREEEGKRL